MLNYNINNFITMLFALTKIKKDFKFINNLRVFSPETRVLLNLKSSYL